MKKLITNISRIYSPDPDHGFGSCKIIESPQVLIDGEKILKVFSDNKHPDDTTNMEIIDAQQCCLLPGFVDAHTHPVFWKTRENEFIMRIEGKSYGHINMVDTKMIWQIFEIRNI